jgi:CO/xanthine dehydrogenase Mo-binding subunit
MGKSRSLFDGPLKIVGQPVRRIDAQEKVTGRAELSADRPLVDGLLYGKTLRAPIPHAEIVRIHTAKAEAFTGVRIRELPIAPDKVLWGLRHQTGLRTRCGADRGR